MQHDKSLACLRIALTLQIKSAKLQSCTICRSASEGVAGDLVVALAAVTGLPLLALSGSISKIVAILVLLPPPLLMPTVNSVGAEIGKPIAPQTASVGVSTTRFVRKEGEVIRHNFFWCLVVLVYLIVISVACYLFFPGIAEL